VASLIAQLEDVGLEARSAHRQGEVEFAPQQLAQFAVDALIAEAILTPKPALVDMRGSGVHEDMNLEMFLRSALSLRSCFQQIAEACVQSQPSQCMRETIAAIGRDGEAAMYAATGGVNTHKGAIWALGLLVAGASMARTADAQSITHLASRIARYQDRNTVVQITHGNTACYKFGVAGARGEALFGFPHVMYVGLPALCRARRSGIRETAARLDTLLAITADLDDTCLLHRAGAEGLIAAKQGARQVLLKGGSSTVEGEAELMQLERTLHRLKASPGGSADLLAATLFLDSLKGQSAELVTGTEGSLKDANHEI
jgi:triphosphoribosyl-dephospho-CoA synthase